jgi:hypothetical protein
LSFINKIIFDWKFKRVIETFSSEIDKENENLKNIEKEKDHANFITIEERYSKDADNIDASYFNMDETSTTSEKTIKENILFNNPKKENLEIEFKCLFVYEPTDNVSENDVSLLENLNYNTNGSIAYKRPRVSMNEIEKDHGNTSDVNLKEKEKQIKKTEITIEKNKNPFNEIEKDNPNNEAFNNTFDLLDHKEKREAQNIIKLNKTDEVSIKTARNSGLKSEPLENKARGCFNLQTGKNLNSKAVLNKKHEDKNVTEQKNRKSQLEVKEETLNIEDDVIVIDDSDEDVVINKKSTLSTRKSDDTGRRHTAARVLNDEDEIDSGSDDDQMFSITNLRKTNKHIKWSEKETIYLVHGVETLGLGYWSEILLKYKNYFNVNRKNKCLDGKYRLLQKNNNLLCGLRKKAELLKKGDLKNVNNEWFNNVDWSETETIYLVHGVKTIGRGNWKTILSRYKNYFDKVRIHQDLFGKYIDLEKNKKVLDKFEKKAELLNESDFKDLIDERFNYSDLNEKETIYLVHGVKTLGRGYWSAILFRYKNYFNEIINSRDLRHRYIKLERDENVLDSFEKKAELLKESDLKMCRSVIKYWHQKETTYLVHAVSIMGKNKWNEILTRYKNYFDRFRRSQDLRQKYHSLRVNNHLKYYLIRPELLEEMK